MQKNTTTKNFEDKAMNELTIVKNKLNYKTIFKTSPVVFMYMANNRIMISDQVAKILQVDKGDRIIFGFDFKTKKCYCSKSNDPSAFVLNRPNNDTLSFASKNLRNNFEQVFKMPYTTLILTINPNSTGEWFELKQIDNE
jgi:hypothetical protein